MSQRFVPEGGHRLKPFRTPRVRAEGHLAFLRKLPCVACAATGLFTQAEEAAHLRTGSERHGKEFTGGATKPHDRWALPLCRTHHDQQHSMNELMFWKQYGVDPFLLALVLWGVTRDDHAAVRAIYLTVGKD